MVVAVAGISKKNMAAIANILKKVVVMAESKKKVAAMAEIP